MAEKRKLSAEEAAEKGVVANHEQMPNGEYRYRLMKDGAGYILTVAAPEGAWQNSHYHKWVRECYIVQAGWMVYAEETDNKSFSPPVLKVLKPGESFVSQPGIAHNVYLPVGAEIHTVKFGDTTAEKASGKVDWHASPELDKYTKCLTEDDIWRLVSSAQ